MLIHPTSRYLTRHGQSVTIERDRGAGQVWRWVTSKGYYVTADGRAALRGQSRWDLMQEVLPC